MDDTTEEDNISLINYENVPLFKQEIEEDYHNIELDEIQIVDWIKTEEDDGLNKKEIESSDNVVIAPHKSTDFICNICKSKFLNRKRLVNHIKTHINFRLNNDTDENIELDHPHQGDGKFRCDNCLERFQTLSALILHCDENHNEKLIKCKQCDFECVNYLQMIKHEQDHSRKYVCEHCSVIFDQLSILNTHKLSSHSDKKNRLFTCALCYQSFTTISVLKSHVKSTHATRFESWDVCTICRKLVKCIKIHSLKFHGQIKIFNNICKSIKIYSCWSCDGKFGSLYALKRHMMKHSVERPFLCKICDKGFRFETILEIHLRIQHCN